MQLGLVIVIVALAAAYVLYGFYKSTQATMRGKPSCTSCPSGSSCCDAGSAKKDDSHLTPLELSGKSENNAFVKKEND